MQQSCTYGSVRGALGNRRPYRDKTRAGRVASAARQDARSGDAGDAGHLQGAATRQIGGRRRNPSGSKGLRSGASLRLVSDETASPSSPRLARVRRSLLRDLREFCRSLLS